MADAENAGGVLGLADRLLHSGKVTATTVSLAVLVLGGPYGIDRWILQSEATKRWLDIREAETAAAGMEHGARIARLEARVGAVEENVKDATDRLDSVRTVVGGVETITVSLCVGLNQRLELGVDCTRRD